MLPERHFRDIEKLERNRRIKTIGALMAVFLVSMVFAGPLIHELSHVSILEAIGCDYELRLFWEWGKTFHGAVQPLCYVQQVQLFIFYVSGYASTLIAGGFLTFWSVRHMEERRMRAFLYAGAGLGLMSSIVLSIGPRGDFHRALKTIDAPASYRIYILVLVLLIVSSTFLRTLEIIWDTSEGQD